MEIIKSKELLSALVAHEGVSVVVVVANILAGEKRKGKISWKIQELASGYSTPLIDKSPAAIPIINWGSLHKQMIRQLLMGEGVVKWNFFKPSR